MLWARMRGVGYLGAALPQQTDQLELLPFSLGCQGRATPREHLSVVTGFLSSSDSISSRISFSLPHTAWADSVCNRRKNSQAQKDIFSDVAEQVIAPLDSQAHRLVAGWQVTRPTYQHL